MDWLSIALQAGSLAFLFGIFYRLGRLVGTVAGHDKRIGLLEGWRDGLAPIIPPAPRI